ncbi:hypothetical protein R1sor_019289 [Riccia sorocarpa]|uniref:UPF3 domain-containing protein n=1 Tax=Riccia sorocarpa TaxID=122646 RepID=A0ABD3IC86_9MARC
MPRIMAQEQSSGVRRRSLESTMKEPPARTKVVLRHLPPSLPQAVLLDAIQSKYAERYTWFNFHQGKISHKRPSFSQAYIHFKKSEDVFDFYEDFDGHVFVNERGTQCKASVEYAPYQRVPKPRSKKDVREGTITKDPDYLEFLETLGKPQEFLPSAEVQLERREAEKAAAIAAGGAKETVVVTPLMEFVRQRRAAKAAPQRSLSSKLGSRPGGVAIASLNLASHKRALERSRSGSLVYGTENSVSILTQKDAKDVPAQILTSRREDQQRKDREMVSDRKKKDALEGKEKKAPREASIFLAKGNSSLLRVETGRDRTAAVQPKDSVDGSDLDAVGIEGSANELESSGPHGVIRGKAGTNDGASGEGTKDVNRREGLRRKQLLLSKEKYQKDNEGGPGSPSPSANTPSGAYSQRHRTAISPRVSSPGTPSQQVSNAVYVASSGDGNSSTGLSKSGHRREVGRNASRGGLSPREHAAGTQQAASSQLPGPAESHAQQSSSQAERGGKRPPRPQSARTSGKEQVVSSAFPSESDIAPSATEDKVTNASPKDSYTSSTGSEKQDARRVRNKDRPDRPVWTPRRRSDSAQTVDASSAWVPSDASTPDSEGAGVSQTGSETLSKPEKTDKGAHRQAGKLSPSVDSGTGEGKPYQGSGQLESARGHGGFGSGYGSGSPKVRYVESSGSRSSRGGRASGGPPVISIQERTPSSQGDNKSDWSSAAGDAKTPHAGSHYDVENGDTTPTSTAEKERRKQDSLAAWNELSGGGHRSGGRRERVLPQGSKEGEGANGVESNKPVKRSGSLALGSNEKQVWVAVQKSGSGTQLSTIQPWTRQAMAHAELGESNNRKRQSSIGYREVSLVHTVRFPEALFMRRMSSLDSQMVVALKDLNLHGTSRDKRRNPGCSSRQTAGEGKGKGDGFFCGHFVEVPRDRCKGQFTPVAQQREKKECVKHLHRR